MAAATGTRRTRAQRRPPGGAHALERVLDEEGTTVLDRLLLAFRNGAWVEGAAGLAGVAASTVYDWLREGARLEADVTAGKAHPARMAKRDRLLHQLTVGVAVAVAEHEDRMVSTVTQLAVGGLTRTRTKVRSEVKPAEEEGGESRLVLLEEVTTEELLPSLPALTLMLERRHPDRWGRREQIELTGPQGGPVQVESPLPRLVSRLEQLEARRKNVEAIIEATATEEPPA